MLGNTQRACKTGSSNNPDKEQVLPHPEQKFYRPNKLEKKLQGSALHFRRRSVSFITRQAPRIHFWIWPLQVDNNANHFPILKQPSVPADSTTLMTHGDSAAMNSPAVVSIMNTSTNRCIATHHHANKKRWYCWNKPFYYRSCPPWTRMEMKYCHLNTSGDGTAARPNFTQRFSAVTHTHDLINSIWKEKN